MTDIESPADLQDVLTDLRRHLAWQEEGGSHLLVDRAALTATRSVSAPAHAPTRSVAPAAPMTRPLAAVAQSASAPARPPAQRPAEEVVVTQRLYQKVAVETPRAEPRKQAAEAVAVSSEPKTLDELRRELGDCRRCRLCEGRTNLVFGVGNPRAQLVFVGEGPGAQEDAQGVPFVGDAGQLLTRMIEAMGFSRDEVYICNVVKCRPPGNRNPEPDEIAACEPFLRAQLAAIGPKVIVALGKFAAQTLLRDSTAITRLRGHWREYAGIALMPTFHPAYLLRNPAEKKSAWSDLQQVMKVFGKEPKRG